MPDREPYNAKYCKAVNCRYRHGNKCSQPICIRSGNEKRAMYFTAHGHLADGDIPEKDEVLIDDSDL